jgi:anti-sigma factor RsiW
MNQLDHDPFCEEALGLLEPFLDGDLPPFESTRLREHLERCPACAAELELAAKIQRELRSLPQLARGKVVPFRRRDHVGLRIAAIAALLALAVGGGALFLRFEQRDRPSPREIAQATAEARYALAYIGKVTRRTRMDLREDVLQKRLAVPASRSVSRTLGETPGVPVPPSAAARRLGKEF